MLKTAKLNPSIHYTLISGPSFDSSKLVDPPENVQILKFIKDTSTYIKSFRVVIAPGGHSTIMETLSFRILIRSFFDKEHREQKNNAKTIEEKGYGMMPSNSTSPEVILERIREVLAEDMYRITLRYYIGLQES